MSFLQRFKPATAHQKEELTSPVQSPPSLVKEAPGSDEPIHLFSFRIFLMAIIVSMGGFIFGYDTGQISGFLEMKDFLARFHDTEQMGQPAFSNVRSGTIVALLSVGTLVGAIGAAPIANAVGRKYSIIIWNLVFCVGVIVQVTTVNHWYQIVIGRFVAGLGVGALSVLTPMYQSEIAPRQIRGALVSCYQLFITLGIFIAYCINFGTEKRDNASSWKIPMGIGFVWSFLMAAGILLLDESPRWNYRKGKTEEARRTIAKVYGVGENHWEVNRAIREIKEKLEAEGANGQKPAWHGVLTAPRMGYRVFLGVALQALQQLTGANFYFYYGTVVFKATGLSNSFVTSMILGGVNFGCTFGGLYVVEHFGRRRSLIFGSLWMTGCFLIFASIGHFALDQTDPTQTPKAGAALIVFACLFIAVYAMTWAPIIWAVVGEIYPSRYRALAMGLATSSNWLWNFLIAFFVPFITGAIDFQLGYVFASCNFLGAFVVYFFLCESQGKSLEQIDTMYLEHVKPWKSSKWEPPEFNDNNNPDVDRMPLETTTGDRV